MPKCVRRWGKVRIDEDKGGNSQRGRVLESICTFTKMTQMAVNYQEGRAYADIAMHEHAGHIRGSRNSLVKLKHTVYIKLEKK